MGRGQDRDAAVLLDAIAAGGTDCDLMLGGGVDSISAYSDCFSPYTSVYNDRILPEYRSADGRYTPFSVRRSCLYIAQSLCAATCHRAGTACSTKLGAAG